MDFQPEHLVYLACPACHQNLRWDDPVIVCVGCGRHYPMRDGLPVLTLAPIPKRDDVQ